MADKETLEQFKKVISNLEYVSTTIENLTVHLSSYGEKLLTNSTTPHNNSTRTHGYINWNSTHDFLKTKNWKKISLFTRYCGTLERWENPHFDIDAYIGLENVVDEDTRFPKDDLYVNVNNPLVRAEILYIKEVKRPIDGLVERFLKTAKNDMHTLSSFEEKYALKWAEPEPSNGITVKPVPESHLTLVVEPAKYLQEPTSIVRSIDSSPVKPESIDISEAGNDLTVEAVAISESSHGCKGQTLTTFEPVNDSMVKVVTILKPGNDSMTESAPLSEQINGNRGEPESIDISEAGNDLTVEAVAIPESSHGCKGETLTTFEPVNDSMVKVVTILKPGNDSMIESAPLSEQINGNRGETVTIVQPGNDSLINAAPISASLNGSPIEPTITLNADIVSLVAPVLSDNLETASDNHIKSTVDVLEPLLKNVDPIEVESASKLYENFENILDKLTTQSITTLRTDIKTLKITNHNQLEVIVDLLYEKATNDFHFTKVYADLSRELSTVRVPSDSDPKEKISFRSLLIGKCQFFFEKLLGEPLSTKSIFHQEDLKMIIDDEEKKNKMRATIKFIGELCKVEMLTTRIMEYCIKKLIDSNDENLECLCLLLKTIGEYTDRDNSSQLDGSFKKMQEIVDCKTNNISSRIKSMIKDVIDLRKRKWVIDIDFQPKLKTMEQIEDAANTRKLYIQRDMTFCGGFGIQRQTSCIQNASIQTGLNNYSVDALKLNACSKDTLNFVKLSPKCFLTPTERMYSVFEKLQADQPSHRELFINPASISNSNNALMEYPRIKKIAPVLSQKPFPNERMKLVVKSLVDLSLINPDDIELENDVKLRFLPQYHAALIGEIINVALEKTDKEINMIAESLLHLVTSKTIAPDIFVEGIQETMEFAPDLFIDVPMLYDYLGKILAPQIAKDYITLEKMFEFCDNILLVNQGHLFLQEIIRNLNDREGPSFVRNVWIGSMLKLNQWMNEEQVPIWIAENKLYFGYKEDDDTKDIF